MTKQALNSEFGPDQIAKAIDHTLLKPEASLLEIKNLCEEAKRHNFFSVCVNSSRVKAASEFLQESSVIVCAVVGFPLGAMETSAKAYETKKCIADGAKEIDMVINLGLLKDKNSELFTDDIKQVVAASHPKLVKVILETCLLTDEEITWACEKALLAGAHFVKTSTGFSSAGATVHAVEVMKKAVGTKAKIKASGGIRDLESALTYLKLGVSRLGTSSGVKILQNQKSDSAY